LSKPHDSSPQTATTASTSESEPAAQENPKLRFYRPELDALRFFAFFSVFLYHGVNASKSSHVAGVPYLALSESIFKASCRFGLSMFFFLSSYLIATLLQIEKDKTGTIHLQNFYIRRLLRIWPLYFAYILLVCLLHNARPDFAVNPLQIGLMLAFSGNWFYVWHGFPLSVLDHLWSISVEEQFYLLFPSAARRASPQMLRQGSLVLCAIALIITFLLAAHGTPDYGLWANSFVESLFFGAGAYFATRHALAQHKKSKASALLSISAGFGMWLVAGTMSMVSVSNHSLYAAVIAGSYLIVALGCALILWGFLHLPLSLLPKPLIYLGKISYGLYVFHLMMLDLSRAFVVRLVHIPGVELLVALLLTIGIATLSYEYFEKPFLRLKKHFEVIHSRTA
jgi:peptidoglycan/LPS O-acetylase OafA/YrhL